MHLCVNIIEGLYVYNVYYEVANAHQTYYGNIRTYYMAFLYYYWYYHTDYTPIYHIGYSNSELSIPWNVARFPPLRY